MGDRVAAGPELAVVLGTGPVGRALAGELAAAGREVRVVTRSGSADVPADVEVRAADIASAGQQATPVERGTPATAEWWSERS